MWEIYFGNPRNTMVQKSFLQFESSNVEQFQGSLYIAIPWAPPKHWKTSGNREGSTLRIDLQTPWTPGFFSNWPSYSYTLLRSTPHPGCNRHHQDEIIFLGSGIPTVQPSFATMASWVGGQPKLYLVISHPGYISSIRGFRPGYLWRSIRHALFPRCQNAPGENFRTNNQREKNGPTVGWKFIKKHFPKPIVAVNGVFRNPENKWPKIFMAFTRGTNRVVGRQLFYICVMITKRH